MAGGIDGYSTTPNSNASINGIDVDENCAPSGINNAIRQLMADVRTFANDIGAKAVSSGNDTITLTTETGYTAYADGTLIAFIAGGTNTGAATLNVDSVGAKAVLKGAGSALAAGDITAGQVVIVAYDASADSSSGAWMMANAASLAAILTAIVALSSTGLIARTGSGTVSVRTITGTSNEISVSNGDGVSGAPTLSLPSSLTLTGKTVTGGTYVDPAITGTITEDVYTITDGAGFAINPRNGSVQTVTLGASRTPTVSNFNAGDSVIVGIDDGSAYSITWTTIGVTWVTDSGSAPTLATTGYTWIALWKVGSTYYGARVGNNT